MISFILWRSDFFAPWRSQAFQSIFSFKVLHRDDLTLVSSAFIWFSAVQWQSEAGLTAYLIAFIVNYLTRVRRGAREKSLLYTLEQISYLKQITSTCSFQNFYSLFLLRVQFLEWFSQFECGLEVIEKDSFTLFLPQHRHFFTCFTSGWFFFSRLGTSNPFLHLTFKVIVS